MRLGKKLRRTILHHQREVLVQNILSLGEFGGYELCIDPWTLQALLDTEQNPQKGLAQASVKVPDIGR
jgi:hypothetical protein